jgi:hypothetical protein
MKNRLSAVKKELKVVFVLLKHFLLRFVKKDDLQYEDQRAEFLVFGLVFLGGWSWYLADQTEKHFYMTVMMALTGIFCVVAWERLLLDKKDSANLVVLPVKKASLYASKFLSVLVWVGAVSLAFSLLPAVKYTHANAHKLNMSGFYYFLILLTVSMLANLFVFLLVAALQSILQWVLKGRLLARISIMAQVLLVMGLMSVFVWFPRVDGAHPGLAGTFEPLHYYMPSLWFNGLHESLTAGGNPLHVFHGNLCLLTMTVLLLAYLFSLPLSLKKYLNHSNGSKPPLVRLPLRRVKRWWHALVLRDPVERAVFYFFSQHLKRSRDTKIKLALLMALPIGLVLTQMVEAYKEYGAGVFRDFGIGQVAFPFMFFFLLTVALRMAVERPVTLEANWIFRLTAASGSRHYVNGMKKAMIVRTILPLLFFLLLFYLYFWGPEDALLHTLFSFGASLLLLEVFFYNYRKIPFASTANPMLINYKLVWPIFVILFFVYYFVFAVLGIWLLTEPSARYALYPALALALLGFNLHNRKNGRLGPVFEDEIEPLMLSLELAG